MKTFGKFIRALRGADEWKPDRAEIDDIAARYRRELAAAKSLLEQPPYEEPGDLSPDELRRGTLQILEEQAAQVLTNTDEEARAVAWVMAQKFGHKVNFISAWNHIWRIGTFAPDCQMWLLRMEAERGLMKVTAFDGTVLSGPLSLNVLRRILTKADAPIPTSLR